MNGHYIHAHDKKIELDDIQGLAQARSQCGVQFPEVQSYTHNNFFSSVMSVPQTKSAWLVLAVASGACAAFNGVFAKL